MTKNEKNLLSEDSPVIAGTGNSDSIPVSENEPIVPTTEELAILHSLSEPATAADVVLDNASAVEPTLEDNDTTSADAEYSAEPTSEDTSTLPPNESESTPRQRATRKQQTKFQQLNRPMPARPGLFNAVTKDEVHGIDSRTSTIEDEEEKERKEAFVDLLQSYNRKRILKGTVLGVRRAFDRSSPDRFTHYVTVMYGPYQVFIPANKFTDANFEMMLNSYQESGAETMTMDALVYTYLRARLGAEVNFIVSTPPGTELFVGGDRIQAMRRNRIYYWFGKTRESDDRYLLNEGDKVEARVISVSRGGIRVEYHGVESFIQSKELAWTMLQDAAEVYEPGQRVVIKLMSISRNEEDNYAVSFTASVKRAKTDPRVNGMRFFADGGVYLGEIAYLRVPTVENPNIRPSCFVRLKDGVQCMCHFPNVSIPPKIGTKVYCEIVSHNEENMYLYGKIIRFCKGT